MLHQFADSVGELKESSKCRLRLLLGVISFDVMIALDLFLNAFRVAASICSVVVFRLQFL